MRRPSPRVGGLKENRSRTRDSSHRQLDEALRDAQFSLERFSGIVRSCRVRQTMDNLSSRMRPLVQRWRWIWRRRPVEQQDECRAHGRGGRPCRAPARRTPRRVLAWTRVAAHAGILLVLVTLLLGGGLSGVLARPGRASAGGVAWSPQRLRSGQSADGLLRNYASIPAVPVVIERPRVSTPQTVLYEEESAEVPLDAEVVVYCVREGDTLSSVAALFGLSVETVYWFNQLDTVDSLSAGQELRIPPMDGLLHRVSDGETLDSIAQRYGVRKGNMVAYAGNDLREPYELEEGQELFVPWAAQPIPLEAEYAKSIGCGWMPTATPAYGLLPGGQRFLWPTKGPITDLFGWTGTRCHTGLDIAPPWGSEIDAAAAGTVTYAGWRGNLGYTVEIDHGDGWATRYGHMAWLPEVSVGQWVERGELIGYVGRTGYATGSHLHFEVIYCGAYCDPLSYLD